jgi:hypothetical protein
MQQKHFVLCVTTHMQPGGLGLLKGHTTEDILLGCVHLHETNVALYRLHALIHTGIPIVGLKVLNAAGSGDASSIIAALNWLLETSLNSSSTPNAGGVTNAQQLGISVVNLSLAFGVNAANRELAGVMCDVLARLEQEAGVVAVVAAGER